VKKSLFGFLLRRFASFTNKINFTSSIYWTLVLVYEKNKLGDNGLTKPLFGLIFIPESKYFVRFDISPLLIGLSRSSCTFAHQQSN
jgi:hypothetical protein